MDLDTVSQYLELKSPFWFFLLSCHASILCTFRSLVRVARSANSFRQSSKICVACNSNWHYWVSILMDWVFWHHSSDLQNDMEGFFRGPDHPISILNLQTGSDAKILWKQCQWKACSHVLSAPVGTVWWMIKATDFLVLVLVSLIADLS